MKHLALSPIMLSLMLAACGGSSGDSASNNSSSAASVASNGLAQGMITGFGSVIVNGVHYDVSAGAIEIDGESLVESDLNVGQFVRITGKLNSDGKTGQALKLEGESQLIGPITSIDLDAGTLVALGQTILFTADTFFADELTAAELQVGDIIKVSSYLNAEEMMVATRIALKSEQSNGSVQLTGDIENLDTANMTFEINGTLVNYQNATLAALRGAVLENGLKLRVIGRFEEGVLVAIGNLHPSHLGFKHHPDLDDDMEVTLSGTITDLVPGVSFTIDGTTVLISADTEFEAGLSSDLAVGMQVKVEGELDANQNLVAEEIKLNYQAKISSKGLLESVDLLTGTFIVNGIVFETDEDTSFNDRSKSKVRFFDLADLLTGDTLHVRAYQIAATEVSAERYIATRVERHNPHAFGDDDWKLEIEGVVEAVGSNSIVVEGQEIQISPLTRLEGYSNLTLFLANALGMEVEVKALTQNGVAVAIKIEVEDDHDDDHSSSDSSSDSSSSADSSDDASSSESSSSDENSSQESSSESSSSEASSSAISSEASSI